MQSVLRNPGRSAAWPVLALAVVALAFGGCGSSGGNDNPTTSGPLRVIANPPGATYSAPVNVILAALGQGSSGAVIYYTTDLSVPDDTSPVYAGPILIDADTVLKFYAQPLAGDPTEVVLEGYTFSAIGNQWAQSGHGDIVAEAWRHWDEDGEVQTSCARCHAGDGFRDWAMDGTVDVPAALPMGLECAGCHQGAGTLYDDLGTFPELDHVAFPSGDTVTLASDNNLCIACHQGRSSMVQVDAATPNDVEQDPDYDSYSFINIHYYAAAASLFGNEVRGGYQYLDPEDYESRNTFPSHPDSLSTCVGCHMREGDANHTWFPDLARCLECHDGNHFTQLSGSPVTNWTAIQTALAQLYGLIEDYAANTLGYPLFYDDHAYPYFFNAGGPAAYPNKYDNFDETLLRAAYNYQFGQKEPCGYLHNGTYMRQILHDSIVDLGGTPIDIPSGRPGYVTPTDIFVAKTNEFHLSGHDNSGGEPFRHWDEDPAPQTISTSCARCHSSPGFEDWALDGTVDAAVSPLSVVGCIACHESANLYDTTATRWDEPANVALRPVEFPSGDTADLGNSSNVCMGCHQGRSSGVDVQATIDADPGPYTFINIHYYAAAASFFGADVNGGYEWAGNSYAGEVSWPGSHDAGGFTDCVGCHMENGDHTFEVQFSSCSTCHGGTDFTDMGFGVGASYDAIQALLTALEAEIERYGDEVLGFPIFYDDHAYPYFFNAPGAPIYPNRYVQFNDHLLTAAYNFQVGKKEPCGYIHNADYIRQILYDSLDILDDELINGSVVGFTRP